MATTSSSKSSAPATSVGKNVSTLSTKTIQSAVGAKADGSYGPQTTAAVKAFQKANGLTADGIVGAKTAAAIQKTTSPITSKTTTPLSIKGGGSYISNPTPSTISPYNKEYDKTHIFTPGVNKFFQNIASAPIWNKLNNTLSYSRNFDYGNPKQPQTPVPTTVVSPSDATNQYNQIKTETDAKNKEIQEQKQKLEEQKKLKAEQEASKQVTTPEPATPAPIPTPEQAAVTETQHPGQVEMYNLKTGEKEWVAPGTTGYSAQDPKTRNAVNIAMVDGNTFKDFGDGTYGMFDGIGNYSPVTEAKFKEAKKIEGVKKQAEDIINGIFQLNPGQQAQIQAITNQYAETIRKTELETSKLSAGTEAMMTRYGFAGTPYAEGNIHTIVQNGLRDVASLQGELAGKVAEMTTAFKNDDLKNLRQLYTDYVSSQEKLQTSIDKTREYIQKEKDKEELKNQDLNIAMYKKYPNSGILQTDSPEERQAKLNKDEDYKADIEAAKGLNDAQTQFWAEATSASLGGALLKIPGGLGMANVRTKIMQKIADNSMLLGLTGKQVADSLLDKKIKSKTLDSVGKIGARLLIDEAAVIDDFNRVKDLGKNIDNRALNKVAQPFLKAFFQGVDLKVENNPELSAYLASLHTTLTKYGRVVNAQTGVGGTTVSANDAAQKLVNEGFTVDTVNKLIDSSFIPEMRNTTRNFNKGVLELQNSLNSADGTITPGIGISETTAGETTSGNTTINNNQGWGWNPQ